jgi:hypothetical protein
MLMRPNAQSPCRRAGPQGRDLAVLSTGDARFLNRGKGVCEFVKESLVNAALWSLRDELEDQWS